MKRFLMMSLASATLLASLAGAATNYELLKKVAVAGAGGWDYVIVDEAARRVYIAHATQVDVMDADSLAVVGTIPNTPGAHGVAIATEFGRGYITAGKADAALAASIFHYNETSVAQTKAYLAERGVPVRFIQRAAPENPCQASSEPPK